MKTIQHHLSSLMLLLLLIPVIGWTQSDAAKSANDDFFVEMMEQVKRQTLARQRLNRNLEDLNARNSAIASAAKRLLGKQRANIDRTKQLLAAGRRQEALEESEKGLRLSAKARQFQLLTVQGEENRKEFKMAMNRSITISIQRKNSLAEVLALLESGMSASHPTVLRELSALKSILDESKEIEVSASMAMVRHQADISELEQLFGLSGAGYLFAPFSATSISVSSIFSTSLSG